MHLFPQTKFISLSLIIFTNKGIFCPKGNFYVDPWLPVDYALITHGHADHARYGSKFYLCQQFSVPILKLRLGSDIQIESVDYAETRFINGVKVSFHPAGHIIGSAQIRLEYNGFVTVISGDYKIEYDGISTAFEPIKCNEFVTECTFGLPIYNWLPQDEIFSQMKDWIHNNQSHNKTSVFIAYSLGKAQRIMKGLKDVAAVFVHGSIQRLNDAISSTGIDLPPTSTITLETIKTDVEKQIVILPPALLGTQLLKKIPNASVAICSGWMQVRGSRRWQAADAGFALSDHADWNGLLNAIKATEAEKVYATHGNVASFSKYLNEIGIETEEVTTQFGKEDDEPNVE